MAKTKPALDMFDKTDRDQAEADIIKARGLGLKLSEWKEIDELAEKLQVTPHAVTVYGVRYFLEQHRAGKVKIQVQTKKTL
jgi:hypothetical protein